MTEASTGCTQRPLCMEGHCVGDPDCPHSVITSDTHPELWAILGEGWRDSSEPFVLPPWSARPRATPQEPLPLPLVVAKEQRNDILKDTFCIYCQREYASPANLQCHVATRHPGTYADASIKEAKDARSDG